VIEAATENIDLKLKIFRDLDETVKAGALLVSNTSSISITKIASVTRRPDKVAGMHFMNPVPLMKLVEGIRGLQTSDQTFSEVKALAEKMVAGMTAANRNLIVFIFRLPFYFSFLLGHSTCQITRSRQSVKGDGSPSAGLLHSQQVESDFQCPGISPIPWGCNPLQQPG
jgi:hypothetical protein